MTFVGKRRAARKEKTAQTFGDRGNDNFAISLIRVHADLHPYRIFTAAKSIDI